MPLTCPHCYTRIADATTDADGFCDCPGCGRLVSDTAAMPTRRHPRRPVGLYVLTGFSVLAGLMALGLVIYFLATPQSGAAKPGAPAAHDGRPSTPEEETVRRRVLDQANAPESVTFEKWGPHLAAVEWRHMTAGAGPQGAVCRVVWRDRTPSGGTVRKDAIFIVRGGMAELLETNPQGDDWAEFLRRKTGQTSRGGR